MESESVPEPDLIVISITAFTRRGSASVHLYVLVHDVAGGRRAKMSGENGTSGQEAEEKCRVSGFFFSSSERTTTTCTCYSKSLVSVNSFACRIREKEGNISSGATTWKASQQQQQHDNDPICVDISIRRGKRQRGVEVQPSIESPGMNTMPYPHTELSIVPCTSSCDSLTLDQSFLFFFAHPCSPLYFRLSAPKLVVHLLV